MALKNCDRMALSNHTGQRVDPSRRLCICKEPKLGHHFACRCIGPSTGVVDTTLSPSYQRFFNVWWFQYAFADQVISLCTTIFRVLILPAHLVKNGLRSRKLRNSGVRMLLIACALSSLVYHGTVIAIAIWNGCVALKWVWIFLRIITKLVPSGKWLPNLSTQRVYNNVNKNINCRSVIYNEPANLRDLIAATGLVILLKSRTQNINFLARVTSNSTDDLKKKK